MAEQHTSETFGFQTEAKQLLKLMINSLYSNREIFLRELISNASDAIDKLRFRAIADPHLVADDSDFQITIDLDKEANTVTITDNGIGMTREEVIDQLGTIAKSGTAEFLHQLTGDDQKDANLIGRFGVGFYSAFIVAEEIEVLTCSAGETDGTRWTSRGEDEFSVDDAGEIPRGTQVLLRLRKDAEEFTDDFRLRSILRRYSDHIGVPVRMRKQKMSSSDDDESSETPQTPEYEVVNSATALWMRSRSEIDESEYKEFYKHVSHDFEDPLSWSHNRVEGKLEYTSLLYIPKRAPFDLWNRDAPKGLKLYVQRVFIMDEAEQFLPLYLRFIKGIVDSSDLPLNVSREILQQDDRVTSIRNALTKRVLGMLDTMAKKQPEDYQSFWNEFGEVLKEGAGEDFSNREALAKLLRFASTKENSNKKTVGLGDYVERMIENQDLIYYLTAESYENASNSPHLEIFKERGIEVLVLFDRIDEWLMGSLTEFDGKSFQDVMRGDLKLPGEESDKDKDEAETDSEDEEPSALTKRIKSVLADRVESVRPSKRLTNSPACLALGDLAMGIQMRKIMEASGQSLPESKPHFEYNPGHPLLKKLDEESDDERFEELVLVLFDQATLAEGAPLTDAAAYVTRLNRLLLELLSA